MTKMPRKPKPAPMTPAEYGRRLAAQAPPITQEQARAAARILASVPREQMPKGGGRTEARPDDGD